MGIGGIKKKVRTLKPWLITRSDLSWVVPSTIMVIGCTIYAAIAFSSVSEGLCPGATHQSPLPTIAKVSSSLVKLIDQDMRFVDQMYRHSHRLEEVENLYWVCIVIE